MDNILYWIAAASAIGGMIAGLWKARCWAKRITEGQKCMLRSEILSIYFRCAESRKIKQYQAEMVYSLYEAYKAMGGNSFIENVMEEIKEFEVVK